MAAVAAHESQTTLHHILQGDACRVALDPVQRAADSANPDIAEICINMSKVALYNPAVRRTLTPITGS